MCGDSSGRNMSIFAGMFSSMNSELMNQRVADIEDLKE